MLPIRNNPHVKKYVPIKDCACPHCGTRLRPPTLEEFKIHWSLSAVELNGKMTHMPRGYMRVLEEVMDAGEKGITAVELIDALHADNENKDPLTIGVIRVYLCNIKRILFQVGAMLTSQSGPNCRYRLFINTAAEREDAQRALSLSAKLVRHSSW
jgi:hypothetical protein